MRKFVTLFCLSSFAGAVTVASCVLSIETGPGGHTSDGFGAAGPGGGGSGGGTFSGYLCEVPETPPSGGSCVDVSGDGGPPPDMDAGMSGGMDGGHHGWDGGPHMSGSSGSGSSGSGSGSSSGGSGEDGGSASAGCNPVTNAGCTGMNVCGPDTSGSYSCQAEGSPANVPVCGDCSDPDTSCGVGGVCIALDSSGSEAICVQMCCTDADCGPSGQCDTGAVIPSLPDGVGVCVLP
jgi:hypothetical protein